MSPRSEPEPGVLIAGRYRVDRLIGQGGMGSVWAAHHMVTHRAVALKFLNCSGESEESRLRFLREARAACAVMHPNVVEVLDFLDGAGHAPTMVLELLEGEPLSKLLSRVGRLSVAQTADIMVPVVSAVGTAHGEGIVHRDLKPDNIFLQRERDGSTLVKVLDFGIAKVTVVDGDTRSNVGLTHTGAILGTPMYMSPEQVFGETDLDHRADIWAIGIILYQCFAGAPPTEAGNIGQVFKIIVAGTIKPVRAVAPDLPEDLAQLIDSMLSRDRSARPDDLRPVLAVLQRYSQRPVPSFGVPRRAAQPRAPAFAAEPADRDEDSHGTVALTGDVKPIEPSSDFRGDAMHDVARRSTRARRFLLTGTAVAVGCIGLVVTMGRLSPTPLQSPMMTPQSSAAAPVDVSPPADSPTADPPASSDTAPADSVPPSPSYADVASNASTVTGGPPATRPAPRGSLPRVAPRSGSPDGAAAHSEEDPYGF